MRLAGFPLVSTGWNVMIVDPQELLHSHMYALTRLGHKSLAICSMLCVLASSQKHVTHVLGE